MKSESGIAASDAVREGASVAAYDAVWVASQLGRLDFVSVLLAAIALLLAFLAFPFASHVKRTAREVARSAAEEQAVETASAKVEKDLPAILEERLRKDLPAILEKRLGTVGPDEARDIAKAQSDTEGEDAAD